ncbi:Gfo/Idh/MocA family protein [Lichenicola sp.]|uniref:Gfo/Idh/MocA family protein n=1 Tax=Lichenicola sp. TaxID=2804529 RepID=UPI003B005E69
MAELTRRTLFGSTAGLAAGIGLIAPALGATAPMAPSGQEPGALRGSVADGKVTLPPLHQASEQNGEAPNPMPPGKRLGVAVVGLGALALENIIPGFGEAKSVRLTALVSGEPDKARIVAAQYGVPEKNLYSYADFDRIRDNPDIDIVYIVLPNAMHAEFTIRAAKAGKHVLCEKPMAATVAEAQSMVDACKQANVRLMIAYRLQYTPEHRTVIDLARSKAFGKVRMIEAVNGQNDAANGQWRQIKAMAGGGSLPDVGLYCLNAFRYITGEEPVEITAQMTHPANDPRFQQVEDIAMFTLRFPSGIVASGTSAYSFHESRFLRVHAETGWFGLDPAFGYDNLTLGINRKAGKASSMDSRRFTPKSQFAQEMDAFAASLHAGEEPHTPGAEGLQDMKIMAAIYQAAAGGGIVKLPLVTGLDTTRGPWPKALGPFVPA